MRSPFLVHVSAAKSRKSQADCRYALTAMNVDEPDDLDDDDDDDDDFVDDEEDDGEHDDDEEDDEDDEPETWQVVWLPLDTELSHSKANRSSEHDRT
jgi:hypothetical protein